MLNYRLPTGLPSGSRAAWSRRVLQPLAHGPLTPLSYSLLAEVVSRAWFQYYDRIEFDPMPRARVVRQSNGTAYFNLTMSAQREAEHAAQPPMTFLLNSEPFAIARVEKQGFMAGMKSGRAEKRQEKLLATLTEHRAAATDAARAWHDRIRDYRWTQAEILQIMEEIEPTAAVALIGWLGSRQMLLLQTNRLLRLVNKPPADTLALLDRALGAVDGVTEIEIGRRLAQMGARLTPEQRATLAAAGSGEARAHLEAAGLGESWSKFLADYGHRALNMAELADARWNEDPAPLLRALAAPQPQPTAPDANALEVLLANVASAERKAAQSAVGTLRAMVVLQSAATDALAWVMAGARRWAAGAAGEANADQRILSLDDVYLFELEELKQMMTNEWNTSDSQIIQGKAASRRTQFAVSLAALAPDLLIGDSVAEPLDPPLASPLLDATLWIVNAAQPVTA